MLFKKTLLIKAPIWHVWNYIDDIEKQKQWMTNIVDINKVDDDSSIVYVKEGSYVNIYREKTLNIDPLHRLHLFLIDDKRKIEVNLDFNFAREGNYTILDYIGETRIDSIQTKIMTKVLGGFFSKVSMNKFFKNLQKLAEESYNE